MNCNNLPLIADPQCIKGHCAGVIPCLHSWGGVTGTSHSKPLIIEGSEANIPLNIIHLIKVAPLITE